MAPGGLRRLYWIVLGVLLAACAGPRQPEATTQPVVHEIVPHEDRRAVPAGTRLLRVRNPHGDLRVRITDESQVGIYAVIQRIGSAPLDPQFDWQAREGRFELVVRYPGEARWLAEGGHARGRVDLALFVPAGLALDLATTDGFLQVRKARAAVRARTGSGSMEVSGAADLDLESADGDIAMSQTSGIWEAPVRALARRGRLAAAVPVYADIAVAAATSGQIELEAGFPATVLDENGERRVRVEFGRALRRMRLEAGDGGIFLRAGISEAVLKPAEPAN